MWESIGIVHANSSPYGQLPELEFLKSPWGLGNKEE
jgi:hypothetical protein